MRLRRERADLPKQLEALSVAVEVGAGRLDEERIEAARRVVAKAEERLRHGTGHTLVALLGATGSGKSSVVNAIVGNEVATAGLRRPTTSSTLACYWIAESDITPVNDTAESVGSVQSLLDWLEVSNRHQVTVAGGHREIDGADPDHPLDGLVLLDVPDHDSVEVGHRLEMERIAAHVDLLIWVTDAEKYADMAMHRYLRALSGYGAVTAMVLNKTDLLTEDQVATCVTDIERLLAADGLKNSPVIAMSATTGAGVDDLEHLLAETVKKKEAMVARLEADVVDAAESLMTEVGTTAGRAEVSDKLATRLSQELVQASGLSVVTDAVAAGHRRDANGKVGWPFTRWARQLRPHPLRKLHLGRGSSGRSSLPAISGIQLARSENAVRQTVAAVGTGLPEPWPDLIRRAGTPNQAGLNNRIDDSVSEAVRTLHDQGPPRWWTVVNVLQLLLALAAIAGAVWLGLLAFGAYLRLPEVPTPEYREIPIPTALLIGGLMLGVVMAVVSRRLAAIGARRRAHRVRKAATEAVAGVADHLVIAPMQAELDARNRLRELLVGAGASS